MKLVDVSVSNTPVAGKYLAQAFFEHAGREYEMSVQADGPAEAEALVRSQAEAYLAEWSVDQIAANQKYGVYLF
jgi:hypothetical protein